MAFALQRDNIINLIYQGQSMKKTVEIKNLIFQLEGNKSQRDSISLSPKKNTCRMETIPSEKKIGGGKLFKRVNESANFRRFSQNSPQLLKKFPRQQVSQKESAKCLSESQSRYNNTGVQFAEDELWYSKSNMKISSYHNTESNSASKTPNQFEGSTTACINWSELMESRKGRIRSQPANVVDLKNDIIKRVSKKVQIMKRMTTSEVDCNLLKAKGEVSPNEGSKLFNFDRLYDHCLKKINKGINVYEKDVGKSKDRKYYELKIESTLLSRELKTMRKTIAKRKEDESTLGVVGNVIDLSQGGKSSQRGSVSRAAGCCYKKKLGKITKCMMEGNNPFREQLYGWQIKGERPGLFELQH